MKRAIIALFVWVLVWIALVFVSLMVIYGAARVHTNDWCFDNTGKWYTMEAAR